MKNFIKKQVEYLKDNPEGYWFKRKLYGWGWTPARPAGWVIIGVYMFIVFGGTWYFETRVGIESEPKKFILLVLLATILLLVITWRTGEPPKWQWGRKDTKDD